MYVVVWVELVCRFWLGEFWNVGCCGGEVVLVVVYGWFCVCFILIVVLCVV